MANRRYLCLVAVSVLLFFETTHSVDRNNFKTCDQSGFCKRQRDYSPTTMPYEVDLSSLNLSGGSAEFTVKNTANNVEFIMRLIGYKNGVVRIYMNEKSPIRPRYEVPKDDVVLESQLVTVPLSIDVQDSTGFTLALSDTKARVKVTSPFLLEVISDDTTLLQLNSRGLLKFEHIRVKPGILTSAKQATVNIGSQVLNWITSPFRVSQPPSEETPSAEDDEDAEDAEKPEEQAPKETAEESKEETKPEEVPEEHAVWEEKYKTHEDRKPNGATSIGVDISFVGYEHVYGIPEHADSFALQSTVDKDPYRLYNLDVFEYELHNPMALYGSVPVMLAHNAVRTIGVFWNNPSEMWIDVRSSKADKSTLGKLVDMVTQDDSVPQMDTRWVVESGVLDLYVMLGPEPNDVFRQYAMLTGTTNLPPIYAISYHQSRWNYNDEPDVKQIHDNYDANDIPLDFIWLDIEHTDGKRYFTWDPNKFPSSLDMIANLTAKGRKLVTIVDPHIKRDDNYKIYKEIRDRDFYVKDRDGREFDGWCWPGSSSYPDFTRPEMREYWASKFEFDDYTGTTEDVYTWNDMNEPSVFNGPEITMHKDAQHANGWEHRDVHNLYGFYVATAEGQVRRSKGSLRPFVLTRAFYAGSQRHGAIWTGDNMGEWGHLKISLPMILSQSVTGITFTGADVGGFFRNPSEELVTRWYQTASFTPFFRAHSHLDTKRREPWLLSKENMKIIRTAITNRYALLPYWYTLFYVNEVEGLPPIRPMWSEFPKELNLFAEEEQFMLGPAILVRPVLDEGASGVSVTFPGGPYSYWYDANSYKQIVGNNKIYLPVTMESLPYYYRGGHIIPRKDRVRRSSSQMTNDPYTLVIALDNQGQATGDLYIDDYKSFQYRDGKYIYRRFEFSNNKLNNRALANSDFTTTSWLEAVKILGVKSKPNTITLNSAGGSKELAFKFDADTAVLTIRKPGCNIATDWSIQIGY